MISMNLRSTMHFQATHEPFIDTSGTRTPFSHRMCNEMSPSKIRAWEHPLLCSAFQEAEIRPRSSSEKEWSKDEPAEPVERPVQSDTHLAVFSELSYSLQTTQSSSLTSYGSLWLQALANLGREPLRAASQRETEGKELSQSTAQFQKNQGLIQLLRSWRTGDEQEQRSTWEYLKQSLDEDRLSERKLFP